MLEAADKVLATKPEGQSRLAASHRAKAEALMLLDRIAAVGEAEEAEGTKGEKAAEEKVASLGKKIHALGVTLSKDDDKKVVSLGKQMLVEYRLGEISEGKTGEAKELWTDVKTTLEADPSDKQNVQLALKVAQELEFTGKTNELAAQAYLDLQKILSASKDPQIKEFVSRFDGVVRRLQLMGKKRRGDQGQPGRRPSVRPLVAQGEGGARRLLGDLVRSLPRRAAEREEQLSEVSQQGLRSRRR